MFPFEGFFPLSFKGNLRQSNEFPVKKKIKKNCKIVVVQYRIRGS